MIERHLREELPFLATELFLMEAVRGGADRQVAHEEIRLLARRASEALHAGESNPLRSLLSASELFRGVAGRWDELLEPARFVGRAPAQVAEFLDGEVRALLARHAALAPVAGEIRV